MVSTHSERNAAPDDQRQDDRCDENKPFDHCFPLPAVLAVGKLVPALGCCAAVDGDAVRRRLDFALPLAAAAVLADTGGDLLLAQSCGEH